MNVIFKTIFIILQLLACLMWLSHGTIDSLNLYRMFSQFLCIVLSLHKTLTIKTQGLCPPLSVKPEIP